MQESYNIIPTQHKGKIWSLTHTLLEKLKLSPQDSVKLKFGSAVITVKITKNFIPDQNNNQIIGLSPKALEELNIPPYTRLQIKPLSTNTFQLGPLLGVLTFPSHVPHRLGFYRNYDRMKNNVGLLYVFSAENIDHRNRIITGYYFNTKTKQWEQHKFPYPDAVYDRCYPNGPISHRWLEEELGPGKIFNKKSMITKLDFARSLNKHKLLKYHNPETQLFKQSSDLTDFINRHEEVYLKPVNAMEGFGIIHIKKAPKKVLKCTYNIKGDYHTKTIASPEHVYELIKTVAHRMRPYIIQQGIKRMEYQGGAFSLRSWAMKNGEGKWVMPGIFAKGTFGKGFLTNYMAGAQLVPLNDLFDEILPKIPYNKEQLLDTIEKLTIQTAIALDKDYGPLGELGMDIVFDKKGHIWFIEANGNPGNIPIFQQKYYPLWPNQIFLYPVEYAKYLAGFSNNS